ncbi:hypothetical protein HGM15179_020447, partial [Zosterops borbonicus]
SSSFSPKFPFFPQNSEYFPSKSPIFPQILSFYPPVFLFFSKIPHFCLKTWDFFPQKSPIFPHNSPIPALFPSRLSPAPLDADWLLFPGRLHLLADVEHLQPIADGAAASPRPQGPTGRGPALGPAPRPGPAPRGGEKGRDPPTAEKGVARGPGHARGRSAALAPPQPPAAGGQ